MRRRLVENKGPGFGRAEAERLRETFQDKPWQKETALPWTWPTSAREIGAGLAVMYRSDKWKKPRQYESYKHVCESHTPWRLFAFPGFEVQGVRLHSHAGRDSYSPGSMPDTVAELALFLGLQCRLFDSSGRLPAGDAGIYELTIPKAKLGAGRTKSGKFFLYVYVENEGPKLLLFGDELDVEKDGIVG